MGLKSAQTVFDALNEMMQELHMGEGNYKLDVQMSWEAGKLTMAHGALSAWDGSKSRHIGCGRIEIDVSAKVPAP